ncbi:MAG: DAK2 domain-containing protein [Lachnospiraceae bacterium]|nr:DAK2 domain-containing protein [Lachnospiraceae bacterium]
MPVQTIDALMLRDMFTAGAHYLSAEKEHINDLNVFPVPDGDTGTNMTMTIMSAVDALAAIDRPSMETISKAISSGSLRGARGNSGVILSQLFRGFSKVIRESEALDAVILSSAMNRAVDTAYKAVMKPKEGTILTVAKSMAVKAAELAPDAEDLSAFFEEILEEGEATLARTPEMLPVLKEAGVVDSGGKGLMTVLHGAVDLFNGKEIDLTDLQKAAAPAAAEPMRRTREHIETDDIRFGYCTEFIVLLEKPFTEEDELHMKEFLCSIGDSLVLVADDELVKIHVHTNDPGLALQKGLEYGQLTRLKIDNMREEHRETMFNEKEKADYAVTEEKLAEQEEQAEEKPWAETGFLSVAAGEGLCEIFRQLGCDRIVSGGQSMNPSTDDFLKAIEEVHAKDVFILPNNKNIILAANQARDLTDSCNVHVIPSKTIPQGISAMVSFVREMSPEENEEQMTEALQDVHSGEVTYAVRDTSIDSHAIHEGDIIGIGDKGLLAVGNDLNKVIVSMAEEITDEDSELISVYTGEDYPSEREEELRQMLEEAFPGQDVEINYGGQPVYYGIISVE